MDWGIAIGGILAANIIGLNSKIIWDWLQNRKAEGKPSTYCPFHNTHHHDIEELKRCNMFLKQEVSKHEVILTERTTEIFLKLKTTGDDIRFMKKTIGNIDKSLAILSDQVSRKQPTG